MFEQKDIILELMLLAGIENLPNLKAVNKSFYDVCQKQSATLYLRYFLNLKSKLEQAYPRVEKKWINDYGHIVKGETAKQSMLLTWLEQQREIKILMKLEDNQTIKPFQAQLEEIQKMDISNIILDDFVQRNRVLDNINGALIQEDLTNSDGKDLVAVALNLTRVPSNLLAYLDKHQNSLEHLSLSKNNIVFITKSINLFFC